MQPHVVGHEGRRAAAAPRRRAKPYISLLETLALNEADPREAALLRDAITQIKNSR